jgi:hypothetical protein
MLPAMPRGRPAEGMPEREESWRDELGKVRPSSAPLVLPLPSMGLRISWSSEGVGRSRGAEGWGGGSS